MRSRRGVLTALGVLVATAAPGIFGSTTTAASRVPRITVVAQGLNNPRGLAFGADGQLYVAEAGTGGPSCVPGPRGPECYGTTGSISRIVHGHVQRVVSGLVSVGEPNGHGATGPDGLSQRDDGGLYAVMTSAPQLTPAGLPPELTEALHEQLGELLQVGADGHFRAVAGVGAYDYAWTKRHHKLNRDFPDANPYGVLALEDQIYVVDAASNTLDLVGNHGRVTVLALFPNPLIGDAVPTCIDRGRDGALYVGELTADGNAPGSAVVWRVEPGEKPELWQSGFTAITGCGFGADGSFYVTEFQTHGLGSKSPVGDVIRISRNGSRTSLGQGQVFLPNGFLAGPDGSIYVSNWSILPGTPSGGRPTGQVIRISAP